VALGSPQALKADIPGSTLTLETRDPQALEARLGAIPGLSPKRYRSGFRLETKDPHGMSKKLTDECGALIDALTVGKPSLEDVFLKKTGHGLL